LGGWVDIVPFFIKSSLYKTAEKVEKRGIGVILSIKEGVLPLFGRTGIRGVPESKYPQYWGIEGLINTLSALFLLKKHKLNSTF